MVPPQHQACPGCLHALTALRGQPPSQGGVPAALLRPKHGAPPLRACRYETLVEAHHAMMRFDNKVRAGNLQEGAAQPLRGLSAHQ